VLTAWLGRSISGMLPTGKHQDGRVATKRTRQYLGALNAQAHPIVFDRRKCSLWDAAELRQLVLAEVLQFANDAYRVSNRDIDPLLRWTKLIHSSSPIVVGRDRDNLKTHLCGKDSVDDSVL
jgi:hypothetical protein